MPVSGRAMRSIVVGLAAILVGCASEAPQRPDTAPLQPVVGEGQRGIAERAFFFAAVYQFESGGHRYSLGNASDAQQQDSYSELVFIDGQFACSRERSMATLSDLDSELTQWELAADPGGLEILADRLREACRLAAAAAPVESSAVVEVSGAGSNAASGSTRRPNGSPSDAELAASLFANSASLALADPSFLIVAPLVLLAVGISNAFDTIADKKAVELNAKWQAATTTEEVIQLLGRPVIEFSLPGVNTRVMAYRRDDGRLYYVGLSDDKPIWFHNEYPWLHALAQQAIDQKGPSVKKRR